MLKGTAFPSALTSHIPTFQASGNQPLDYFLSLDLTSLAISYKWSHMLCALLCQLLSLSVMTSKYMRVLASPHNFFLVTARRCLLLCGDRPHLVSPFIRVGYLDCFRFSPMRNAAVSIFVEALAWICFHFLWVSIEEWNCWATWWPDLGGAASLLFPVFLRPQSGSLQFSKPQTGTAVLLCCCAAPATRSVFLGGGLCPTSRDSCSETVGDIFPRNWAQMRDSHWGLINLCLSNSLKGNCLCSTPTSH